MTVFELLEELTKYRLSRTVQVRGADGPFDIHRVTLSDNVYLDSDDNFGLLPQRANAETLNPSDSPEKSPNDKP
jgi:hypothetical protein